MTRDIKRFDSLSFWLRNATGVSFTLKLEIKDYRDTNSHVQYRRYDIPAGNVWVNICATLDTAGGWTKVGQPDLQQARLIGFVFEASAGAVMNGAVYIDDMVLVEPGNPMNSQSIRLRSLVMQMAHRQFDGLCAAEPTAWRRSIPFLPMSVP